MGPVGVGSDAAGGVQTNRVEVVVVQGTVEVSRGGQSAWDPASTQMPYCQLRPGDRIRTLAHSRAAIRLRDRAVVQLGAHGLLEVLPLGEGQPGISLTAGRLYLFHRGRRDEFQLRTPMASPVIRGTEFVLEVGGDGAVRLEMIAGAADLDNGWGKVALQSGEAGFAPVRGGPRRVSSQALGDAVQWFLHYPAVLDVGELGLDSPIPSDLEASMTAYRRGDLLTALDVLDAGRAATSDAERVYRAALLLVVGDVGASEDLLGLVQLTGEDLAVLAQALRTAIAAVKGEAGEMVQESTVLSSGSASVQLARSYALQSRGDLAGAQRSAEVATALASEFGPAWARLAELEFSLGRTRAARSAVDRALALAPRHAPARTLSGYLAAARAEFAVAEAEFEAALLLDGTMGDAWLGRGLCRLRRGEVQAGMGDLLMAAALEPNRALLRSYLGKAFERAGDGAEARRELALAMRFDPRDPTPWLYRALVNQQENRLIEAVGDLETSRALNDNRALYRSRFLLDRDQAVRRANLAALYRDAGLFDEGMREAARAVGVDYANASAHLFLANSYAQLRDPNWMALRYEAATLSEYLLANLMAPVGEAALSPAVSQQEYSRFFDRGGFGVQSTTEYMSRGDWRERAVQYGRLGRVAYALDVYSQTQPGDGPNQDLELVSYSATVHQQLGAQDTLYVRVAGQDLDAGDVRQHYDPAEASRDLRVRESLAPAILIGGRHEWGPGAETLILAGWLQDEFVRSESGVFIPTLRRDRQGVYGVIPPALSRFAVSQEVTAATGSAEVQQIWQAGQQTLVAGARYQQGRLEAESDLVHEPPVFANLEYSASLPETEADLRRASVYVYEHWEVADGLWLVGGVGYDWLALPDNIDLPPMTRERREEEQVSPKAGFLWQPFKNTTLRGAYARSLGGLYWEQSLRIEPTQVAGFNQTFRNVIPESVAGLTPAAENDTGGVDLSQRLGRGTYLGVGAERLESGAWRTVGVFDSPASSPVASPGSTRERLRFDETTLTANLNQFLAREWSVGLRYRLSEAHLARDWPEVPPEALRSAHQSDTSRLHELDMSVNFTHPSGFFGQALARWFVQGNTSTVEARPGDDLWQLDVIVGYRFARRRAELRIGGLNLLDRDYRLSPLNLYPQLPRDRTLFVGLKLEL
jgi:tetratricopeptide (TPR) repeat protein